MLVNASELELLCGMTRRELNDLRSARATVRDWERGSYYVHCDVCGLHDHVGSEGDPANQLLADCKWFFPEGWVMVGERHLCPECAVDYLKYHRSAYDWGAEPPSRSEAEGDGILSQQEAAQLLPDDQGIVHVPAGTVEVGYKAFMYRPDIRELALPDTVQRIADFACACSSLERFCAPAQLQEIGSNAFYQCKSLAQVSLGAILRRIGQRAFAQTKIAKLHIPTTLEHLGRGCVVDTELVYEGPAPTFTVDAGNPLYIMDGEGALYIRRPEGLVMQCMLSKEARSHSILPGTVAIQAFAYRDCRKLARVSIPEGVQVIGRGAFMDCVALRTVEMPSTLRSIEVAAFENAHLSTMRIPAAVRHIGPNALAIDRRIQQTTLTNVEIDPGNECFFAENGLLYRRHEDGSLSVLLAYSPSQVVRISGEVSGIAPNAFMRLDGVREIQISSNRLSIHPGGFPYHTGVFFRFVVDHVPSERGEEEYRISAFDPTNHMLAVVTLDNRIDIPMLLALCDNRAMLPRDAHYILERLDYPHWLDENMKAAFETNLGRSAEAVVLRLAEHGELDDIERMARMGFLNEDNITRIVERVTETGDTAAVACLLDLKNRRFGMQRADFSL